MDAARIAKLQELAGGDALVRQGLLAAGGSGPSPQGTRSRISGGFRQPADPTP
jgi:hypothetical protein